MLYNIRKSKQTHIKNVSKKPLTCAAFSGDGAYVVTGEVKLFKTDQFYSVINKPSLHLLYVCTSLLIIYLIISGFVKNSVRKQFWNFQTAIT